jgi:hypothetical protein
MKEGMKMMKAQLKEMIKAYLKTQRNNPLKTEEDHKAFKEIQIRLNDLQELFYS